MRNLESNAQLQKPPITVNNVVIASAVRRKGNDVTEDKEHVPPQNHL